MATMMRTPLRSRRSGEEDALEALPAGDEERFVELAALYQPLMTRLARSLAPTAREADELVRMAWIDLLRDLDAIDEGSTLRASLIQRLLRRAPAWLHGEANTTAFHENRRVDPLSAALASLPTGPFMVVSLRDVEGWSAEEVSHTLGLSLSDQRRLLHQGRSAIHRALYGRPTGAVAL